MSTARHHAEWLSLVEASGPFLSLQVLLDAFPQGLDAHDSEKFRLLKQAYEEWLDNQQGLQPDSRIHRVWIDWVLQEILEFPDEVLWRDEGIPTKLTLKAAEYGEILRPDWVVARRPDTSPEGLTTSEARLLVQLVPANQALEKPLQGSRWKASPATRMMELLHGCNVRLGLLTNGEQWMLVNAPRGETTGYISWYSNLWIEEKLTLRAFHSLLGVRRFFAVEADETPEALLARSKDAQQEVTDRLGFQVRTAVEVLVQSLDKIDQDRDRALLVNISDRELYEAALFVMMRLVFLLAAEEKGLLLLGDDLYDQNYAVSTLREQLRETADSYGEEILERRYDAWCRLLAIFRAVYGGINHDLLRLPAYGGDLFNPDKYPFLEGRTQGSWRKVAAQPIPINNRTVLHLLEALQLLQISVPGGGSEARRLSFRALDIEQIGHVYEGLLDHTAVRASTAVIGLIGTKNKEPEVPLTELEKALAQGVEVAVDYLKTQTGRSKSALRKGINVRVRSEGFSPTQASPEGLTTNKVRSEGFSPDQESPEGLTTNVRSESQRDIRAEQRLRIACGNDEALCQRVLPFADLIREDTFGYPLVIPEGSVYVTAGTDRRESGTHYTPKSLTEEIVRHTLEPLVYEGVKAGKPREQWQLKSASALLQLKVCDMAMGSGAFLVQVCRYLGERLVEAWENAEFGREGQASPEGLSTNPVRSEGFSPDQESPKGLTTNGLTTNGKKWVVVTPEGELSQSRPEECLIPEDATERLIVAKRIVAERCVYGVDKNPLAVEMAKLSLWLETLQKDKPFTFVDHALKCGDSLVGIGLEQLYFWNLDTSDKSQQLDVGIHLLRQEVDEAIKLRLQIEAKTVITPQDQQEKAYLLAQANARIKELKDRCDLLVGSYLTDLNKTEQEALRQRLLWVAKSRGDVSESDRELLPDLAGLRPFHWELEFPEVFGEGSPKGLTTNKARSEGFSPAQASPKGLTTNLMKGGFDAIVGNPPFMGGQKITGALGTPYREYIVEWLGKGQRGSADLCAYFFLQGQQLIGDGGTFGLVATNTIAQGDTREVGLDQMVANGGTIYQAVPSRKWEGSAALEVAYVWLCQGKWQGKFVLDEKVVKGITPYLTKPGQAVGKPYRLVANANKSFQGSNILGLGFTMSPEEAQALIAKDPKNKDVLFPYLNGQDLNSNSDQSPSRWVINFFDWALDAEHDDPKKPKGAPYAADYPDCLAIVEEKVKPERAKNKNKQRREIWWRFTRPTIELYDAIADMDRVLVHPLTSKHHSLVFYKPGLVMSHMTVVLAIETWREYALLQSEIHWEWVLAYGNKLETRPQYTPTDCFETFPFPETPNPRSESLSPQTNPEGLTTNLMNLEEIGKKYYTHRQTIMETRQEGLTKTYNRFHDPNETAPDILTLRQLHIEMDTAVAAAYGWDDLPLNHDFHDTKQGLRYTISEDARREVLDRLLQLNHDRYAAEVEAGLHNKKGKKNPKNSKTQAKSKKSNTPPGQQSLF